jgi:glyceraldehyde 3-phosphate dehydrogenase
MQQLPWFGQQDARPESPNPDPGAPPAGRPEEVFRGNEGRRPVRVGINGFGRMGRLALRAAWGWPEITFAHINELKGDVAAAAHLLTFDSVHGRWAHEVSVEGTSLHIDEGPAISVSSAPEPGRVPWREHGVDIVIECSGTFRTPELLAPYFERGVRKVIVAAPVKDHRAFNVVMGVNDRLYDPAQHHLLTAASCTTNCLAPLVKVLHEGIGIRHGLITTIHDMTNTQTVVDAPHKDLRRARASSLSLIPTSTGSATAIGLIFPELLGKLDGIAVRVPLLNASLTDGVFEVARPTTVEEVNALFQAAAASGPLQGILGYEERPLVSVDYRDDTRSAIVDALSTMVTDDTQVKVLAWYDNEIGYVHRMMELVRLVASHLSDGDGGATKERSDS